MAKIIIDIDNTLWDLAPVLYERLSEEVPHMPHYSEWKSWHFWKGFVTAERLYGIIKDVHMEQDRFEPYGGSRGFLQLLRERGFYMIIASHREQETLAPTRRWLEKNGLPFDEIHLSYDKSVLFDNCWGVVDDSPVTLEKAKRAGIVRVGLRNPWNDRENHPLFNDLGEVYEYLRGECVNKYTGKPG